MQCIYCKEEIREQDKFCSKCGRMQNNKTNEEDNVEKVSNINLAIMYVLKNRKMLLIILTVLAIIIGTNIISQKNKKIAIVGTWETESNYEITFGSNKTFTQGTSTSGTYEIYDDNKLVLRYKGFDYIDRDTWTYEWNEKNKGGKDCWYISGDTLYIGNDEFKRK